LTEQHEQLKQALTILAVQAVLDSSPEAVKDWKESSKAPYQFGIVSEKSDATKWARTVESFPWLILVDSKRTVLDEGFGFEELSDKLAEHKVTPAQPANLRLSR
jgi:hypothetical protein